MNCLLPGTPEPMFIEQAHGIERTSNWVRQEEKNELTFIERLCVMELSCPILKGKQERESEQGWENNAFFGGEIFKCDIIIYTQ